LLGAEAAASGHFPEAEVHCSTCACHGWSERGMINVFDNPFTGNRVRRTLTQTDVVKGYHRQACRSLSSCACVFFTCMRTFARKMRKICRSSSKSIHLASNSSGREAINYESKSTAAAQDKRSAILQRTTVGNASRTCIRAAFIDEQTSIPSKNLFSGTPSFLFPGQMKVVSVDGEYSDMAETGHGTPVFAAGDTIYALSGVDLVARELAAVDMMDDPECASSSGAPNTADCYR